jgi:hypothetical protein
VPAVSLLGEHINAVNNITESQLDDDTKVVAELNAEKTSHMI